MSLRPVTQVPVHWYIISCSQVNAPSELSDISSDDTYGDNKTSDNVNSGTFVTSPANTNCFNQQQSDQPACMLCHSNSPETSNFNSGDASVSHSEVHIDEMHTGDQISTQYGSQQIHVNNNSLYPSHTNVLKQTHSPSCKLLAVMVGVFFSLSHTYQIKLMVMIVLSLTHAHQPYKTSALPPQDSSYMF